MQTDSTIDALINLLDDPDEGVYEHVRHQIRAFGQGIIPSLEGAWESNDFGRLFQNRIEQIIHEIQFEAVLHNLREWKDGGGSSLLDGAICINRYQYPDLDQPRLLKTLDQIQQAIWLELNGNLTAFEQVKVINHILFDVFGFSGNTADYHSPKNSFLSEVLESKKGNPLSLSLIYSIIAQNLELPIYGVNLPRHFILAYLDRLSFFKTNNIQQSEVLFYVNPFSRGNVFGQGEVDHFLEQLKLEKLEEYYRPCDNVAIIRRALKNLEHSYIKLNAAPKIEEVKKLLDAIE